MQIITLNLNGIRAAAKKGFLPWLAKQTADVVCVQELKAQLLDLSAEMQAPDDYHGYFHCAGQKGYSGVGIYTRKQPDRVVEGIGITDIDAEGRFLQADFGDLSIVSIYLPSGSRGEHRQAAKFYFMEISPVLQTLMASGRQIILCGTGISRTINRLENWRSNQKTRFLPEERLADACVRQIGFVDVFRRLNSDPEQYTWWSNRGQAWKKMSGGASITKSPHRRLHKPHGAFRSSKTSASPIMRR